MSPEAARSRVRHRSNASVAASFVASVIIAILAASTLRTATARPLDPPHWSSHTISLPNGELHFVTLGSGGVPLIAINGGPGFDHTIMVASPAWARLARSHEVVLYDQRGTGESTSALPPQRITVDILVRDLEVLREHLGVGKIDLLGWSWGGYLAMAYAAAHPEHLAHLVLVDSAPPDLENIVALFGQLFPDVLARIPSEQSQAARVGCSSPKTTNEYLPLMFYDPVERAAFMRRGPYAFSQALCASVIRDSIRHDLTSSMRALRVPTLVISGRFDAAIAPVDSFNLSRLIPSARLQVMERSGHLPFMEQPGEFAEAVRGFLNGRPVRKRVSADATVR